MPFICENVTLPFPNCSPLLKYCNDHFGNVKDWCQCMETAQIRGCYESSDYTTAIKTFEIILAVIAGLIFMCIVVSFLHYVIKTEYPDNCNCTCKYNQDISLLPLQKQQSHETITGNT
jgi:hypothetical protein